MLQCMYRSPVRVWLKELQTCIEVESMNALQAKSVATTQESFDAFLIRDSQIMIQQMRKNSIKIIDFLDYFIDQIPIIYNDLKLIKTNFTQINEEIHSIVRICRRKVDKFSPNTRKLLDSVCRSSQQIIKLIDFFTTKRNVNNSQLESTLRKLKEHFGELINQTIKSELKVIKEGLIKRTGTISLKWSLLSCCSLAQNDAYICRILIHFHNMVKPLVEIVNNYTTASLRAQQQIKAIALRVLTILCVNREAVKQLITESIYSQFLVYLIINESSDLIIKEAVDLMVQLTKPFIDSSDRSFGVLPELMSNDFIYCLTKVIKTTTNVKVFLLSCAAIANISFTEIESIVRHNALTLILNESSVNKTSLNDIFIKDQIITIVANIAHKYPLHIVSSGGLVFVLNCLQTKSEDFKKSEELLAFERMEQKVSVAIARLAPNPSVTQVFFRLNVVQRLIQLCKDPKERHFSDSVLIACVAALKRLAKSADKTHPIIRTERIANNSQLI